VHLAEDLALLLTPAGTHTWPERAERALAAAVLIERALAGDPEVTPAAVEGLMAALGQKLYERVLEGLVEQGAVRRTRRGWWARMVADTWWVWRLTDQERRDALVATLVRVFVGETEADTWTGPLIALLYEINALDVLHAETRVTDWDLARDIAEGEWVPEEYVRGIVHTCIEEIWQRHW
jgi:hypothetical protein